MNAADPASAIEWITRAEAATILGVSASAVRKFEAEKRIASSKEADGSVVVSVADVERLALERSGDGQARDRIFLDLYSKRNAALDDARVIIEEQRKEATRKDLRITELENRMQEVHAREARLLREVEELETFRHERDLELRRQEHAEALKDRALEKAGPLMNALAMKLGGPQVAGLLGPGGNGAAVQAIRDLKASLTPEQATKLTEVLTAGQAASVLALLESVPDAANEKG